MGCRKETYFLEFMYADVARDFVGAVVHVLLDGAKGSHNHWDCIITGAQPKAGTGLRMQTVRFFNVTLLGIYR